MFFPRPHPLKASFFIVWTMHSPELTPSTPRTQEARLRLVVNGQLGTPVHHLPDPGLLVERLGPCAGSGSDVKEVARNTSGNRRWRASAINISLCNAISGLRVTWS